jgi:hypothetical protein
MASKLTKLTQQKSENELRTMSRQSLDWLKAKIASIRTGARTANPITKEVSRFANKIQRGHMYCYYYDPKTKDDLPYYDKFPLIIALELYGDGFLGLNLHYLPLIYRIAFLEKLMDRAVLDKNGGVQRLKVSYDILNAAKRYKEFKPCLKKYLYSHLRSHILVVEPEEFDVAALLPIYQFSKATPRKVWADSVADTKEP